MSRLPPYSEALAGVIIAVLSLLIARTYLRPVSIETRPGLALDKDRPPSTVERTSEATAVGLCYLLAAVAGMALLVHAVSRMRL